jgi:hypothetical protein
MEILQSLPPLVTLVLGLLLVVWLVLFLLVPFMLESIRSWSRKTCQEVEQLNAKLDRLTAIIADRRAEPPVLFDTDEARPERKAKPRGPREPRSERTRKEPTILG